MKKWVLISVGVAAIVAVGICYLTFAKKDNYATALPADAKTMAVLNVRDMAESLNMERKELASLADHCGLTDCGVDLSVPVYGFVSKSGFFGMLTRVSDASDLSAWLEKKGIDTERQRGMQWSEHKGWLFCRDNGKLLIMGPASSADEGMLRSEMANLMEQKESQAANTFLALKGEGFLHLTTALDALPVNKKGFLGKLLPKGLNLSGLQVNADMMMEGNALRMQCELNSGNAETDKFCQTLDTLLRPVEGTYLQGGVPNPFLWLSANVKGSSLLDLLRRIPALRTALIGLNMCVDADMMIRAVDGDVSVSVPMPRSMNVPYLVEGRLNNTDFLKNASDWGTGIASAGGLLFNRQSPTDFSLQFGRRNFLFGVWNKSDLYVASDPSLIQREDVTWTALEEMRENVQQSVLYLSVDMQQLFKSPIAYALAFSVPKRMYYFLESTERMNVSLQDGRHITLDLVSANDIRTLLNNSFDK